MNSSRKFFRKFIKKLGIPYNKNKFFDYKTYWDNRYNLNGNSGLGSTGVLAEYKKEIINSFVEEKKIITVIEFGCGDGCQLELSNYPKYLGLDVAKSAIDLCQRKFTEDRTKSFMLYNPRYFTNHNFFTADLVLCLDVLYHIIDEDDYIKTIHDIFHTAQKYVIIYSNLRPKPSTVSHIIYRDTLKHLENYSDFQFDQIINQKYPELTNAQFIILSRINKIQGN